MVSEHLDRYEQVSSAFVPRNTLKCCLGYTELAELNLFAGPNFYEGITYMVQTSTNGNAIFSAVSLYAQGGYFVLIVFHMILIRLYYKISSSGKAVEVLLRGRANSTSHTVLRPAVAQMAVAGTLPPSDMKLLTYAEMLFSITELLEGKRSFVSSFPS